jgi:flagellar motor switch protein FliM
MLRQKFDQQWSLRKTESTDEEQERALRLIQAAKVHVDARLNGEQLRVEDMLELGVGDVIAFDHPIDRFLELEFNGKTRYRGQVVENGRKRAFLLGQLRQAEHGERADRAPLRSTVAEPTDE